MRDFIRKGLEAVRSHSGSPYKLGIVNTGGTVLCLPNEDGELEPVKSQEDLLGILNEGGDFGSYVKAGLLELNVLYHNPNDSSQILDEHREPWLQPIADGYAHVNGFLVVHGTDTAAQSARFLHLTLPAFNPVTYWEEGRIESNWTKPAVLVAGQESTASLRDGQIIPNSGSDADINLTTALAVLAENSIGEVGIVTNGYTCLRGPVVRKVTESHIPAFDGDRGVRPLAERTSFSVNLENPDYIGRRIDNKRSPFFIPDSGAYEDRVLLVDETAHLALCETYLEAVADDQDQLVDHLRSKLPAVILYGSRGAGNVQGSRHYPVLKQMEQHGVLIAKVPLDGGRVPEKMHYAVPGGDILGVNIEAKAGRYKAQCVLALADQLRIEQGQRKEFFSKMMRFEFGAEMLPQN